MKEEKNTMINMNVSAVKDGGETPLCEEYYAKSALRSLQLRTARSTNGAFNLIENSLIEVKKSENEYLEFNLSGETSPGYYELIFEIILLEKGVRKTIASPIFPLHKIHSSNDSIRLEVLGKYYDTPAQPILELDNNIWERIKKDEDIYVRFLGPNILEPDEVFGNYWKVSSLKRVYDENAPEGYFKMVPLENDNEEIDLNIPIEEKIWSLKEFLNQFQPYLDKLKK